MPDGCIHISFFGWCSFFLFYDIKKMATDGEGGVVDGRRLRESWPFRHIEKKGDLFRLIFG
jgi:hypothetical protein